MVVAVSPLAQLDGVQVDTPLTEAKSLLSRAASRFRRQHPARKHSNNQKHTNSLKHTTASKHSSRSSTDKSGLGKVADPSGQVDPFFRIFQHVPQDDREALQALAAELDSFSPIVGLQTEVDQPDCIFLDITGLESLFGSESKLAQEVVRFCQSQGYLARVGIAHTIGFAQGLAQHATNQQTNVIVATGDQCQSIVSQSAESEFRTDFLPSGSLFYDLPIESLRLKRDMTQTLGQLGIFRIGQLLQVPRKELFSRFGTEIYTRLDQMSGRVEEPVEACPRPREFFAEQLLDHPTNHKETIEVIVERLIQKICQQLRSSQQGALQWTIRLYGQQKLPIKLHVRLFAPTAQADQIIQLAKMQLEQVLQPELVQRKKKKLSDPVAGDSKTGSKKKDQWIELDGRPIDVNEITVTVASSVLLENRQRELFDENPRADKQALAHLINRLSGRLGHRNVVVPSLVSGNQPEYSYQMKPLVHSARRQNKSTLAPTEKSHVMARPIRMLHPPQPIDVITLSPKKLASDRLASDRLVPDESIRSMPPVVINLGRGRNKVTEFWGPERIETGWWRGTLVRRDYWKVELDSHQQFWIYFDLRKQSWFLQGEF